MPSSIETLLSAENWMKPSSGPIYIQLRQHLIGAIRSGEITAGESLPSEREMAQIGDVSRVTVRKAVQQLVRDGYVVQKRGSGTSVAPQLERVQQSLSRLTSFSEDMARRGLKVRSTWLEKGIFPPSPEETMVLGLPSSSRVARVERLRIADDVPLAIERASLSPAILPNPEKVGSSLYETLAESGNKPVRATQRISARNLGGSDASLLAATKGDASLNIERISYSTSGKVIEFTRSIYRGDAYDFVAELQINSES